MGIFSDLLAEDMSKLCVDVPRQGKQDGTLEKMVAPLLSLDVTRCQGASSDVSNTPGRAAHCRGDRTKHTGSVSVFSGGQGFSNQSLHLTMFSLKKLHVFSSLVVSDRQSLPGWRLPESVWWVADVRRGTAVSSL